MCESHACNKMFVPKNKVHKYCGKKCARRERNPKKDIYDLCKSRAQRRGIYFDLKFEDIKWPTHCEILGIELEFYPSGRGRACQNNKKASIDRIDSSKDYTADNIQIISVRANNIKTNATKEEIDRLYEWYNK